MWAQAWLFCGVSGIDLNIFPLHRFAQDGGQCTVIGDHAGRGQRLPMGGDGKCLCGLHPYSLGNGVSRFLIDGLAVQGLIDGGPADTGISSKGH